MDSSKGTTGREAGRGTARPLGWPLVASVLVHVLALGAALWWAADRVTPERAVTISTAALRPAEAEPLLQPDVEVEPPTLEELELPVLDEVVFDVPVHDLEQPFEEDLVHETVEPPPSLHEVPLSAARVRRAPVKPMPAPVVRPQPPVRPRTVSLRPARRAPAPTPPRVAPSLVRRTPLRVVWAPDPRRYYPQSALQRGLGGRAFVRLTIGADGRVRHARIEHSSGSALLDQAALAYAYANRFTTGHGLRSTRMPVTFRPPRRGGLGF